MKPTKNMSLTELLIAYDETQKKLEEIRKPNSDYISKRVKEVFGDKSFIDKDKLNKVIENL